MTDQVETSIDATNKHPNYNRPARPGPLTADSLKSIRATLRKHRDLTAYVSKVLECQDPKLLDSIFITLVRSSIKDKLVIFVPSTSTTVMTYAHVKPGIYSVVTYIREWGHQSPSALPLRDSPLVKSHNFSYHDFFNIDRAIDLDQPDLVNVQYISSDYDLLIKQRANQADGKVLCPLKRRAHTQQQGIALTPTKQLVMNFLVSKGITDPIGRVISRTGQFLKAPNTDTLTPEQIDIITKLAAYFKEKPGSRITNEKLILITDSQKAKQHKEWLDRVPIMSPKQMLDSKYNESDNH
jgi:predicted RNA-binding protein YlqC (UPF0109 family)